MTRQIEHPEKITSLILAADLTGLALLTRYSAAAFVAAAGLGWLILARVPWRQKLGKALLFGVVALLPMMIWALVQLSYTSGVASRTLENVAGMAGRLASFGPQFGAVLLSWLLPASWIDAPAYPHILNIFLTWGLGIVLIALGAVHFWKRQRKEERRDFAAAWPVLIGFFILIYLAEIFVVYLTTYPPITLDNRMFSPLHVGVLMLLPLFLWSASRRLFSENPRLASGLPIFILAVFGLWYAGRDVRIVKQNFDEGLGYNSQAWRSSELVEWVNKSPPKSKIVTNETMALLYLTGRTAYPLAEIFADKPQALNARYGSNPQPEDKGQKIFAEDGAPLVLFDSIATQFESIYGEKTEQRIQALTGGLEKAFQGKDGAVYYAPK
jgi:hypothetical protein